MVLNRQKAQARARVLERLVRALEQHAIGSELSGSRCSSCLSCLVGSGLAGMSCPVHNRHRLVHQVLVLRRGLVWVVHIFL